MTIRWVLLSFLPFFAVLSACDNPDSVRPNSAGVRHMPSPMLYVWARDANEGKDDTDFLAVLNADPASSRFGDIMTTVPVGAVGTGAHHAETVAPDSGYLFANGFRAGRTFLFDLSRPNDPTLAGELDPVPGFNLPHSFVRLEDGDVIVTLQTGDSTVAGNPGGLARFDATGHLLKVTSAADPDFPGEQIMPYSVEVLPDLDRAVTTSRSMSFLRLPAVDVVQVWRLSDLTLLKTLRAPRIEPAQTPECSLIDGLDCESEQYPGESQPFEARAMADGSALVNTITCGFYRISGLDGLEPTIETVLNWPDLFGCSVPAQFEDLYVMPVMFDHVIVVLDLANPRKPKELFRYEMPGYSPHWIAADPRANRFVVTADGPGAIPVVLLFNIDLETGEITPDQTFGEPSPDWIGVNFDRPDWPHGATGPAIPHAALFAH